MDYLKLGKKFWSDQYRATSLKQHRYDTDVCGTIPEKGKELRRERET